ncbi:MAG: hypothetical protein VX007_06825, partial [Pseudomonadota bacterium]|nr:hypothetical protein [Pseudomonadota bacterium]
LRRRRRQHRRLAEQGRNSSADVHCRPNRSLKLCCMYGNVPNLGALCVKRSLLVVTWSSGFILASIIATNI